MISGKKTEKEYRDTIMDSSSSLKDFSLDRRKYHKKYVLAERIEDEDSKASVIGRIVETLLLEKDQFDNRFFMSSVASAPTGNMLLFVEALYKHTRDNTGEDGEIKVDFDEIIKAAYKDSGYKWTLEKVLEKFTGSDAEIYYKEIREVRSKNLTVVTVDDVTNAEKTVEELKTNPITADIVNKVDSDNYSVYNQLQIEGYSIMGMKLKSMLDKVIVDHKKKEINIYDLKCVWAVENFYEEYYLYRRSYIQAYLYKKAVEYHFKELINSGYRVINPQFIVCDSINYYSPLIYTLDDTDMDDAFDGFTHRGRVYPGVGETILGLKWAKENDQWRISFKNFYKSGVTNIKG